MGIVAPGGQPAKATDKRDTLVGIEKRYQAKWKAHRMFEIDAPSLSEIPFGSIEGSKMQKLHPKFFGTMAYPYSNGTMHAGHSFTASKIEFATGFARMQGKRALFPLGFHCTGMPIKACADKLTAEIELFGATFQGYKDDEEIDNVIEKTRSLSVPAPASKTQDDVTKFASKRGKTAGKTLKMKYQFQIMLALGIPKEDIYRFADTAHWLQYFPPVCISDLDSFGARIDWRRQFVTTDANPYYDSFVRWQMNRLLQLKKIQYGSRYTIYSPKDGQPCMDHDRNEGEGIAPQEYTAVKLRIIELSPQATELFRGKIPSESKIFLVAATLRQETVYGQTCCFVGPAIQYGLFKVSEDVYYITTQRAAWNMAFQGVYSTGDQLPRHESEIQPIVQTTGSTFIGTLVSAPFSFHKQGVRVLPLDTVLSSKGTGVAMSVPSDSPDDYVALRDLSKKAKHYGIEKEWAELEIVPLIETPTYGNLSAPFLANEMNITSPKDATQLAIAKNLVYKEGHYKGKMLVGEFQGESVLTAKPKIRDALFKEGHAFAYAEPDGIVMSRSGDECVVAYVGQWFLNYGPNDPSWQAQVLEYVSDGLESFSLETKHQLTATVQWLNQWACARSYGLGSKLPWDPNFLVESLSDSTIYQAYYTVAHLLHADRFGKQVGAANVRPEQMSDEIWDCIFAQKDIDQDLIEKSGISQSTLQTMRREFEYWYPLDMGVTGKDLVPNHVTFFLYIHLALFPREHWPQSVRSNGHLLLNGKKMSKSTGNFLTLKDAIEKYGADATRVTLADAGDTIEDANFEETVANSSILRLFTLKQWCEEMSKDQSLRTGPCDTLWDKLFENEINTLVHNARRQYEETNYRSALRSGFYNLLSSRDFYREAVTAVGIGMHKDLVRRYIELQALVVAPIIPHWADYIWSEVLEKPNSIQSALWPSVPEPSLALTNILAYIRATCSNINSAKALQQKKRAKGKLAALGAGEPQRITLFVALAYPPWQELSLAVVRDTWCAESKSFDEKLLNSKIEKVGEMKKVRPFVQGVKNRLLSGEIMGTIMERTLLFDEMETSREMIQLVKKVSGFEDVRIMSVVDWKAGPNVGSMQQMSLVADFAVPGHPSFHIDSLK